MENYKNVIVMSKTSPFLYLDTKLVECGFIIFPLKLENIVTVDTVHQALEKNHNTFWKATRIVNKNIEIYLLPFNSDKIRIDSVDPCLSIIGKFNNYKIVLGETFLSMDEGKTFVDCISGFCIPDKGHTLVLSYPNLILPIQNSNEDANLNLKNNSVKKIKNNNDKLWWQFWR